MTTEEKATAYAERYEARPMAETAIRAYIAGATEALASQWRSVEEEMPSNDDKVFVIIHGAYVCGWYDHKYELWEIFGMGSYNRKDASYWMPIPPIHDTNTDKI